MILSAEEFIRLRTSEVQAEYHRAAHEEAPAEVWWDLVRNYPDMKVWVVHNKTVPLSILEALSTDESVAVRGAVARKRSRDSDACPGRALKSPATTTSWLLVQVAQPGVPS